MRISALENPCELSFAEKIQSSTDRGTRYERVDHIDVSRSSVKPRWPEAGDVLDSELGRVVGFNA